MTTQARTEMDTSMKTMRKDDVTRKKGRSASRPESGTYEEKEKFECAIASKLLGKSKKIQRSPVTSKKKEMDRRKEREDGDKRKEENEQRKGKDKDFHAPIGKMGVTWRKSSSEEFWINQKKRSVPRRRVSIENLTPSVDTKSQKRMEAGEEGRPSRRRALSSTASNTKLWILSSNTKKES
ncbi:hypothetical protein WA026_020806 [Henosepilachna vigintioctopunctata]|uniref:Uncharacterized protein n=1 Tax=Henosepilachna vigintioctopunctata TaxID=420089 RepID=A0AAW1TWV2_9CUCU